MPSRSNIKEINKIVRKRKGKCLDQSYVNSRTPLRFECEHGHQWATAPYNIKAGTWCPSCNKTDKSIVSMQALAAENGGKCLSKEYKSATEHLIWECKNGHQWSATPNDIKRGRWCSACAAQSRRDSKLAEIVSIAAAKAGRCLSTAYIDNRTKLKFECAHGHKWSAVPYSIKSGSWCPQCYEHRVTLDDMHKLAADKGGKCLSKRYRKSSEKLSWECSEGHQWKATPSVIKAGSWCPDCALEARRENYDRLTIEEMHKIAKERKGRCLSTEYVNAQTKLKWQCSKGHQWEARPGRIKQGTWCPECAKKTRGARPLGLDEMHVLAEKNGGKCLSKKYVNNKTKLTWKCSEGHIWDAAPSNIKRGGWCPKCWSDKRSS